MAPSTVMTFIQSSVKMGQLIQQLQREHKNARTYVLLFFNPLNAELNPIFHLLAL
jgi:hypothetical protein